VFSNPFFRLIDLMYSIPNYKDRDKFNSLWIGKSVQPTKPEDIDNDFELLKKLVQVMRDDPLINEKIIKLLRMDSFQRRAVLNNWLEQLRIRKAPDNLLQALSSLFDDKIADQVLAIINGCKI